MKPKHKKIFYKISYLLFICIISFIDSISNKEYLYLVSNPLIFVILDFIVIRKIMKEVEKDQYRLQKNILNYFFTINNLFIAVIMFLFSCNIFAIIINLFTNIILVTLSVFSISPLNDLLTKSLFLEFIFIAYPSLLKRENEKITPIIQIIINI